MIVGVRVKTRDLLAVVDAGRQRAIRIRGVEGREHSGGISKVSVSILSRVDVISTNLAALADPQQPCPLIRQFSSARCINNYKIPFRVVGKSMKGSVGVLVLPRNHSRCCDSTNDGEHRPRRIKRNDVRRSARRERRTHEQPKANHRREQQSPEILRESLVAPAWLVGC